MMLLTIMFALLFPCFIVSVVEPIWELYGDEAGRRVFLLLLFIYFFALFKLGSKL